MLLPCIVYMDALELIKFVCCLSSLYLALFVFLIQDVDPGYLFEKPNIYCHFSQGIGEAKYFPTENWAALNKLLLEGLDSYNEVNAVMNLASLTVLDNCC